MEDRRLRSRPRIFMRQTEPIHAHVKGEMNATWFSDGPIRYNPEIGLPEYHIMSLEHDYCNGVFHYTITPNSSRLG
uniref:PepX_C domain-containing protein n=1 Tax=Heterorhabditis bacteriophora TaxID=37862 RepID=A0A1I7WZA6_HETBA